MGDNSYSMNNKFNTEPDFNDPEWYKKVTDWNDFWTHQKWDMEVEGLDDEHDVAGNPVCSEQRVIRLFAAIRNARTRSEVMQWMPPPDVRAHFTTWENPPSAPEREVMNPDMTYNDLRALSEKRERKRIMDAEWRRRQSLVGKLRYPDPYLDARLDFVSREVRDMERTDAEWRALITMDGLGANPEDHQARVENPLVPADFVQTMGVYWVEETEDYLASLGHLATPDEEERFDTEVIIDALDFVGMSDSDLLEEVALEQGSDDDDGLDDDEDDGLGGGVDEPDADGIYSVPDGDRY